MSSEPSYILTTIPIWRLSIRAEREFLLTHRDLELGQGRYSQSFGTKLLPGMVCLPTFTVPKKPGPGYRLINDQRFLNRLVRREKSSDAHYNDLADLEECLMSAMEKHDGRPPKYVWKSDVRHAYRCLPVHPRWQIRQVVRIDGSLYIDRCLVIGGRASSDIFARFMSLVAWLAVRVHGIDDLLQYSDDHFSYEYDPTLQWYEPYRTLYPKKQVALLRLWDQLGIPHDRNKQVFGQRLEILGKVVDVSTMSITLLDHKRTGLICMLREFIQPNKTHPLREWINIANGLNDALSVNPLLKLGLTSLRAIIKGHPSEDTPVPLQVQKDLTWLANKLKAPYSGTPIRRKWDLANADMHVYCSASMNGLGLFCPSLETGRMYKFEEDNDDSDSIDPFDEVHPS